MTWEWHDEGIYMVPCDVCGYDFATNCTGFVVCAECLTKQDRENEAAEDRDGSRA